MKKNIVVGELYGEIPLKKSCCIFSSELILWVFVLLPSIHRLSYPHIYNVSILSNITFSQIQTAEG